MFLHLEIFQLKQTLDCPRYPRTPTKRFIPILSILEVLFAVLLEADSHANFLHSLAKVKED